MGGVGVTHLVTPDFPLGMHSEAEAEARRDWLICQLEDRVMAPLRCDRQASQIVAGVLALVLYFIVRYPINHHVHKISKDFSSTTKHQTCSNYGYQNST